MLNLTQFLIFELGTKCNLGPLHQKCPNMLPWRDALPKSGTLTSENGQSIVVESAVRAYNDLGFTGYVGFHFYNEPSLEGDIMLSIMARIRAQVPKARFILWTNGTNLLWTIRHRQEFAAVVQSDYATDPEGTRLDGRLDTHEGPDSILPCVRPFTEFIIDHYGNHHPCCADWEGKATLGNIFDVGFDTLVQRFGEFCFKVSGMKMAADAPQRCRRCTSPYRCQWNEAIPDFDKTIKARTIRWRGSL
jgi:hypothetical protein